MKIAISGIALVLAASALASAPASASASASAPASAKDFDGFRIGITAGYNHDKAGPKLNAVPLTRGLKRDSAMIGIFAGYDTVIAPHVLLGVEASLNGPADNKLHNDRGAVPITIDPRLAVELSARAGYLVNDKLLAYVRGGCSSLRLRTTVESASTSTVQDGWHAGAGLEYALSGRLHARAEYRYTDFGSSRATYQRQQALIGVSYRL